MRKIDEVQRDIERCQGQIANTFDPNLNFENESDRQITREGFQLQLRKLFREKSLFSQRIENSPNISNGHTESSYDSSTLIQRRSLEACRFTIQQVKDRGNQ